MARRGLPLVLLVPLLVACHSAEWHHAKADRTAYSIVEEKQRATFGKTEAFSIEHAADTLRRRIIEAQQLPTSGAGSLGSETLEPLENWPEDAPAPAAPAPWAGETTVTLSLAEALQVGARNSREYQTEKEAVFLAALDLDFQRNSFRTIWGGSADALAQADQAAGGADGVAAGADLGFTRLLKSGALVAGSIGIDLVRLISGDESALGVFGDLSIAVPLLRGASKFVVTEPLTQAERNVVYALQDFQRFRRVFAVQVASEYLDALRLADTVRNSEENYRGLTLVSRRSRALAAAGRLSGVGVDQARQDELRARDTWIAAIESYRNRVDRFKETLGLPPDAEIELKREELDAMIALVKERFPTPEGGGIDTGNVPPADAKIDLPPPDTVNRGPLELEERRAVDLAFDHRQDLRVVQGRVYDAQRGVVVAADALKAGLTLTGSASAGETRSILGAGLGNGKLDPSKGLYQARLLLDLPFERTAERNAYREAFIQLERSVRALQAFEDGIKLQVRETLRRMLSDREGVRIQTEAVRLARDRVQSTSLLLEAGRVEIRDVLDAQASLLEAQNSLTAAMVSYRISSLEIQRDLGVLEVDETGLLTEYKPDAQQ